MKNKLLIIISFFVFTISVNADFSDVNESNSNKLAIDYLEATKVIEGYRDGTFKPNLQINRAEALKILMLSQGFDENSVNLKNCFPDVGTEWFASYVCYAKGQNWISGYGDDYFRPANSVSLAEILKMAIKIQNLSITESQNPNLWYEPYFNKAFDVGIIDSKNFDLVNKKVTRGEVSDIIFRAIAINKLNAEKYTLEIGNQLLNSLTKQDTDDDLVSPKISFNNQSDGDLIISRTLIDQILWESEIIVSDNDALLKEIIFTKEGEVNSVSNFSLYLNGDFVKGADIKNNNISFFDLEIKLNKGNKYLIELKADIENNNYSVNDEICGFVSLKTEDIKFNEANVEINNSNKLNGRNICLDALGLSPDKLKYIESPDPQIVLTGANNIFVGALQFKGEIEPVNINDLAIIIEEINTAGMYNGSNGDRVNDVNAIKDISLYYSDGTPVLTKVGQKASAITIANKKALLTDLDLQLDRLTEQSILVHVSLYGTTFAKNGMAFKVKMSLDNNDCDITGITSGNTYSCSNIIKDSAKIVSNENYIFENKLSVVKTDNQPTGLYKTQDVDVLKFQLIPKRGNNTYFTQVKNMNISCSGSVKVIKASIYAGRNLLGSSSSADLCNQDVNISFSEIDLIDSDGEVYVVKVDVDNASSDDNVNILFDINGTYPGNDDICWQVDNATRKNYLEICWIDMPEDKSFTFIENKIRR